MHDTPLPLTGRLSDGAMVTLASFDPGRLTQIAGWADFPQAADRALAPLGLTLPPGYDRATTAGEARVWRLAPDRALVRAARPPAGDDLAVLDLSDARVGLRITGAGAAALLARLVAVELTTAAFPPGRFVQAPVHHVGVLIERLADETFELLIPTSWAQSLTGLMAAHLHAPSTPEQDETHVA